MVHLRALIRFACLLAVYPFFFLLGIALNLVFLGSERKRHYWLSFATVYLGRCLCYILNIRVKVVGTLPEPGSLIVSNHVGSPDIFILGACFQVCFVSKLELRNWPVLGLLTRLGATLFVDRSRRHAVKYSIEEICGRLQSGISVVLFPEGGVSDGSRINPFKTSHFESAIVSQSPVVPVLIHYHDKRSPSIACWWNISFLRHFYALLQNPRLDATVTLFPPLTGQSRHYLAQESFRLIHEAYEKAKA